ncbi:MAG TPA: hypothetical protein VFL99_13290 [Segeticoccus sp.]|uniref:hypothetical protein n=1 Tax=Segeticoccus sp. TaxID=2706531 RepID=UPI002D7E64A2|nr:hypothetical protein [Segeticoccus sp.]HET8601297.1 hypothetical protein [Segeticoccus sp.]
MTIIAALESTWISVVLLLPWAVGLVLALRHQRDGGWARLAAIGCGLLLAVGLTSLLRNWWVLTHMQNFAPLTTPGFWVTWSGPMLAALDLLGLSLVVAAIFVAGRSALAARAANPPATDG